MKKLEITVAEWKDIHGYEGLYKISNHGKVYSCISNRLLKLTKNDRGYCVQLTKDKKTKNFSVARLVAEHYVENPYNYKHIYFIDGNPNNIKYYNIQWGVTNKNTKIVVDGMVFNSLKEYKDFCRKNEQVQYLMNLEDICEVKMPTIKEINAEFKI